MPSVCMRIDSASQFMLGSPSRRRSTTWVKRFFFRATQVSSLGSPFSTKTPGRTSTARGMTES